MGTFLTRLHLQLAKLAPGSLQNLDINLGTRSVYIMSMKVVEINNGFSHPKSKSMAQFHAHQKFALNCNFTWVSSLSSDSFVRPE